MAAPPHPSADGFLPLGPAASAAEAPTGFELVTFDTLDEATEARARAPGADPAQHGPDAAPPSVSAAAPVEKAPSEPVAKTPSAPEPAHPRARGATISWAPTACDAPSPLPANGVSTNRLTNAASASGSPLVRPLTEVDGAPHLGTAWSARKKWLVLSAICVVQLSMNFNASVYANAFTGVRDRYGVSVVDARWGQMLFLVMYGVGSELWAPWSEEWGRWGVLQGSLLLVNLAQVLCATAPSFGALLAGRALGGLCSAGGSVTLGVVADLWAADAQQYAVASVVLASVAGSALGPIAGGCLQTYLPLPWIFWAQLIFGGAAQALHWLVPETRASVLLDREARRQRAAGAGDVRGPGELKADGGLTPRKVLRIWARPFVMFATEPIVLLLSLLSGFSDALIFTFLESFRPVLTQWGFSTVQVGLAFTPCVPPLAPLLRSSGLGTLTWRAGSSSDTCCRTSRSFRSSSATCIVASMARTRRPSRASGGCFSVCGPPTTHSLPFPATDRMTVAPLEAAGLFGFAWTSSGPPIPWAVCLFFAMQIAIANVSRLPLSFPPRPIVSPLTPRLVCNLHGHHRLHGRQLRALLGLGHGRQRPGPRPPCRLCCALLRAL